MNVSQPPSNWAKDRIQWKWRHFVNCKEPKVILRHLSELAFVPKIFAMMNLRIITKLGVKRIIYWHSSQSSVLSDRFCTFKVKSLEDILIVQWNCAGFTGKKLEHIFDRTVKTAGFFAKKIIHFWLNSEKCGIFCKKFEHILIEQWKVRDFLGQIRIHPTLW